MRTGVPMNGHTPTSGPDSRRHYEEKIGEKRFLGDRVSMPSAPLCPLHSGQNGGLDGTYPSSGRVQ